METEHLCCVGWHLLWAPLEVQLCQLDLAGTEDAQHRRPKVGVASSTGLREFAQMPGCHLALCPVGAKGGTRRAARPSQGPTGTQGVSRPGFEPLVLVSAVAPSAPSRVHYIRRRSPCEDKCPNFLTLVVIA